MASEEGTRYEVQRLPSLDGIGCYLCGDLPISFGTVMAGYLVRHEADELPACGYHLDMTMTMWETIWLEKRGRA
ncbi:MAG: hypothetical protein F4X54_07415 [Chloroflexi bacterium]|nr:hypothetical protein [Chloroflexota bacterium]MYB84546.1 hypothetical protein [Chloroflexota bacterium]